MSWRVRVCGGWCNVDEVEFSNISFTARSHRGCSWLSDAALSERCLHPPSWSSPFLFAPLPPVPSSNIQYVQSTWAAASSWYFIPLSLLISLRYWSEAPYLSARKKFKLKITRCQWTWVTWQSCSSRVLRVGDRIRWFLQILRQSLSNFRSPKYYWVPFSSN